jgi:hypothetical protein
VLVHGQRGDVEALREEIASVTSHADQSPCTCARRLVVTVTLDAGGADTYTSRAITGPEQS